MKVLFICSANKERSKTADDYFSEKYPSHEFQSAGTNLKICQKEGTIPLDYTLLKWADRILVMEEKHRKKALSIAEEKIGKKVTVLNIPDIYGYYQKELIQLLEEKCVF